MDRTNSMGLWHYAKDYSDAGRVVVENLKEAIAPSPAYYLYCHAIELALKAYLRGSGARLEELKQIGHDLSMAYKKALAAGIKNECKITLDMERSINLVNQVYREKEFEYIKTGARTIPTIAILRATTDLLVVELKRYCYDKRNVHN